jgi:hypothetical protein
MSPVCSLSSTVRHELPRSVGLTQASSVIPVVRSSELESGMFTMLFVPLNESALPNLPVALQVAPLIVPLLPLPDWSASAVPDPWSIPYDATRPALVTTTFALASLEAGPTLPAASSAVTL